VLKIFVQIASYRDPELLNTIKSCLSKSQYPERLTFGVVNQYNEEDPFYLDIKEYEKDERFQVLNVPYKSSLGACWARSKTNEMYKDEDFILQIDSHSRFVENWDTKLIDSWQTLKDEKAVYTSYPPPFDPSQEEADFAKKYYVIHVYAIEKGMTKQRPKTPEDWKSRKTPYLARHVGAGFIFGKGSIIKDVPYDPDFYFSGEESSITLRLYTHGYNLYHPNDFFLWHYYQRKQEAKHWNDQKTGHLTAKSRKRLACLLGLNSEFKIDEKFSLGKERTAEDFKRYSGIDFERNILHKDAEECKEPPVDQSEESWSLIKKEITKTFKWENSLVDEEEDVSFWAFFIKDPNNNTIQRKDIKIENNPEIINKKNNELDFKITYYHPAQEPKSFVIWPHSKSKKWLKKSPAFDII
jgi:hypothetical protein